MSAREDRSHSDIKGIEVGVIVPINGFVLKMYYRVGELAAVSGHTWAVGIMPAAGRLIAQRSAFVPRSSRVCTVVQILTVTNG